MNSYVIDAVAFLSYLADVLPPKSDKIFKMAELEKNLLILPSIVLGECLYTIYKGREIFGKTISLENVDLIFKIIRESSAIQLVDMDLEAWEIFNDLKIPEMHDRIIVATARNQGVKAIITTDPEIAKSEMTIWN